MGFAASQEAEEGRIGTLFLGRDGPLARME
jgi:hypothetical protein